MSTVLTVLFATGFVCTVFGLVFSGLLWLAVAGVVVSSGSLGYGIARGHFLSRRLVH